MNNDYNHNNQMIHLQLYICSKFPAPPRRLRPLSAPPCRFWPYPALPCEKKLPRPSLIHNFGFALLAQASFSTSAAPGFISESQL